MSAYNNIRARIANLEGMIRDGGLCDLGEERARMKIKRLRRELLRIDCETLQSALVLAGRRAGINRLMRWKPKERAAHATASCCAPRGEASLAVVWSAA